MVNNITAVIKKKLLIPARPIGKDFLLFTHIPFLDRNNPDSFSTRFQEYLSSKKAKPFRASNPALVDHKDLSYIKEYLQRRWCIVTHCHRSPVRLTTTPRCKQTLKRNYSPSPSSPLPLPSDTQRPLRRSRMWEDSQKAPSKPPSPHTVAVLL